MCRGRMSFSFLFFWFGLGLVLILVRSIGGGKWVSLLIFCRRWIFDVVGGRLHAMVVVIVVVGVGVEVVSRRVDVGLCSGKEAEGCIGSLNPRYERHRRGIVRAMTGLAQSMGV